jgi:hypothetical protein
MKGPTMTDLATLHKALNETAGKLYSALAVIEAEIRHADRATPLDTEIEQAENRFLETYLGDGIYAAFGCQIHLRGPRAERDCVVLLEPPVFAALVAYGRKTLMPAMGSCEQHVLRTMSVTE